VTVTDLQPLHDVLPPGLPDTLREIAEWLYLEAVAHLPTLTRDQLAAVALAQAERLSDEMGGTSVYLHRGRTYRLTPRNIEMCRAFKGDNYRALARRYKLSEQQVRNIVDRWQHDEFMRKQGNLFGA
jgi:Mor family transcriptional regulator